MRLARKLACHLLAVSTLLALPAHAKVYDPETATLENGLRIIVVPNHRAPVVHQMLWYKVGSVDEAPGQSGLAHYLEHLMFKGTATTAPGQFSKEIAAVGGRDNAFTSYHYTAYFATVPLDFLPRLMALEADRMQNLRIEPDEAKPELDVVLAERRQRVDDDPDGRFAEKFAAKIYGAHPLGRPIIGWRNEVAAMDADMATAFYRRWYAPNNAVLIISGAVDLATVLPMAQASFGKVPARALPKRVDAAALYKPRTKPDMLFVPDKDVRQVSVERHYTAPSYHTAKGYDAFALQVLEQILDGGTVGWLYRELVAKQSLAIEVGAQYNPLSRDLGSFTISLNLPPKANVGKATAALNALLAKLVKDGVTEAEVALAVKRLREQAIFTRDHLMTPGYAFGQHLMVGLDIADVENWPENISRVKVAAVNAAARALFGGKDFVTGTLLPEGKSASTLGRRIGRPARELR